MVYVDMSTRAAAQRRLWRHGAVVRRRWPLAAGLVLIAGMFGGAPAAADPLRIDSPAIAGSEKKKYPEIEEARLRLAKQDIDGALESLTAAAKAHPELPSPHALLAATYMAMNRPREARIQLEKAVVESPTDPEPYLVMADSALREGRFTEAGLLADKGIAIAQAMKGDAETKTERLKRGYTIAAAVAQSHEQWEEARKLLTSLLKISPDSGVGHFRLGTVLFELKKPKEAYAELQAAARMDDEIPSPETTMGRLFEKSKDRANAEKWMKQAVAADPKKLKTRLDVAQWLLAIGKLDEAQEQVDEALKIEPTSQDALFLAGRVARFAKEYPQAQKFLERAYLEAPGAGAIANELALTLNEMGEDERKRALVLAEATYRQTQGNTESAATFGWICLRSGRVEDAEKLLSAAVQQSTQGVSPDAIYFYAMVADARSRADAAKPLLELALKSDAPFAYRADAQKLLDRLGKTKPAAARAPTKGKAAPKAAEADKADAADSTSP